MIKRLIILITDIAITVSLLLGIWIYYYKIPRYGVKQRAENVDY